MNIIEIFKSIIIGIIQGITEWLPVSSTGHMILADQFIAMDVSKGFRDMFLVLIQLGSIMAVVFLYFKKLNPFSFKTDESQRTVLIKKDTLMIWYKVIIGALPAAVIGLLFDKQITAWFYNPITIALTLIIYGVIFIVVETMNKKTKIKNFDQLSYKTAIMIGVFQTLALIPGTSRSGATIIGAVLLGASRYIAAEFSFFLAIPVMFGASFLKIIKYGFSFSGMEIAILLSGMITAFIVSVFVIKLLMGYIKKHDFKGFGYYRIALGVLVFLYFIITGSTIQS